ncbi:MAG TPA: helix-turn-helix domain-containing protein [Thermoleophilaceae bacterium]|nr:helix-turn-helix domain-containing protein [Thermoleophilaceae bacterium]
MAPSTFSDLNCSIARTLEIVGSRWTLLVLRDLFAGITRFDAIQADLGISRKVLAERLASLEEAGVVERRAYQDNPPRHDYLLTQKGSELGSVLLAMIAWGDRWEAGADGPPMLFRHEQCGQVTHAVAACSECGEPLDRGNIAPVTPPGSRSEPAAV